MKNPSLRKGFDIEERKKLRNKKHLELFGCTECAAIKTFKFFGGSPDVFYVNCPDCGIIYKFDFVNLRAERVDVSWDHLLKIACD